LVKRVFNGNDYDIEEYNDVHKEIGLPG